MTVPLGFSRNRVFVYWKPEFEFPKHKLQDLYWIEPWACPIMTNKNNFNKFVWSFIVASRFLYSTQKNLCKSLLIGVHGVSYLNFLGSWRTRPQIVRSSTLENCFPWTLYQLPVREIITNFHEHECSLRLYKELGFSDLTKLWMKPTNLSFQSRNSR